MRTFELTKQNGYVKDNHRTIPEQMLRK